MEFPNATTAFDTFAGCRSLRKIGNQTIDSVTGTANSDGVFDFTNVTSTVTTFENCHRLEDKMFLLNLLESLGFLLGGTSSLSALSLSVTSSLGDGSSPPD